LSSAISAFLAPFPGAEEGEEKELFLPPPPHLGTKLAFYAYIATRKAGWEGPGNKVRTVIIA